LNDGIISLILRAESEYRDAVRGADIKAEDYADECAQKQDAYLNRMRREWAVFEKEENENLQKRLLETEQKTERDTAELKERLRACQSEKAEAISERLKREVLAVHGDC